MTLNDIYHISMIIVGFGTLALGWVTALRMTSKNRRSIKFKNHNKKNK